MTRILLMLICAGMSAPMLGQEPPSWQVLDTSSLRFQALQQGAEFTGKFDEFDVQIQFDRGDLTLSELTVIVDVNSINTDYDDRDEILRSTDLFDVARWPEAMFRATEVRDLGTGQLEALGVLTIRDQARSVLVPFTFTSEGTRARMSGEIVISRLDYGIGQGDWTNTDWVGRDVTIQFDLELDAERTSDVGL